MSFWEVCARFVGLMFAFAGVFGVFAYMVRTDKLEIPAEHKKLLRWSFYGICAGTCILAFLFP